MQNFVALHILSFIVGVFFLLARFRFVYDPNGTPRWFNRARQASLTNKMIYCGYTLLPVVLAWFIAGVEIIGGAFLLVGLYTRFWSFVFIVLLLFATACTAKEKVAKQNPVDCVHWFECYLWCPEPLYIVMCVAVFFLSEGWL